MGPDVNKIYFKKIKSKDNLISLQKMLLEISFDFMSVDENNFDEKVNNLLEKIGIFLKVDRSYIFNLNHDTDTIKCSHNWLNKGIDLKINTTREIFLESFPWFLSRLNNGTLFYAEDLIFIPTEAIAERDELYKQGIQSFIFVPITDTEGRVQSFIGVDSVTSTKQWAEEELETIYNMAKILSHGQDYINYVKKIDFMASYDELTQLPKRLFLIDRINQGLLRASREKRLISVMFINLDGFKIINDTLGRDQGDELLIQVSRRLLNIIRKNDTVCRQSGDEFILYFDNYKDEENLDTIAYKVLEIFKKPFTLRDREYRITGSIGVSQYPKDGDDVDTLINNAEIAMYKAKSLGKNQYQKCSTDLKNLTLETITLTNDLYRAIEQNQMMLYYQPQVNGLTGDILGVEALLRWKHPQFGFVSPFKFIPLAEKTRLILPIGNWVLKTACEQCNKWLKKGLNPIKIAVNFSAHQLNHPNIIIQIEDVLEKTSLEPKYLEIEITESSAIDTNGKIKKTLEKIKNLGIHLSIDDFGKEYSSLNRIKELPIDRVKIDMSFVKCIGISDKDEAIIKAIISLASNLGLETVAEGVETKEQVDFLNKFKCNQLQGYYFYKPMPAAEMEDILLQLNN